MPEMSNVVQTVVALVARIHRPGGLDLGSLEKAVFLFKMDHNSVAKCPPLIVEEAAENLG